MHFTVEQNDNVVIFTIKEPRLDATIAGDVKAELLILCQPDVEALIIDLTAVQACDSAGLSALLLAQRLLSEYGAPVVLVGVQPSVLSLMKMVLHDRVYPMFDSVDAALADLQEE